MVVRCQWHNATSQAKQTDYEKERASEKAAALNRRPVARRSTPDKRRLAQALQSGLSQYPAADGSPKSKV
jgi:hypothetical protein